MNDNRLAKIGMNEKSVVGGMGKTREDLPTYMYPGELGELAIEEVEFAATDVKLDRCKIMVGRWSWLHPEPSSTKFDHVPGVGKMS